MYPIQTETVYIIDRLFKNTKAKTRLDNILEVIQPKEQIILDDSKLQNLISEKHWTKGYKQRTGHFRRNGPPTLIFNTFRWNRWDIKWNQFRYPKLNYGLFLGNKPLTHRSAVNHLERNVCQAAWELHSIFGCLHSCDYCHVEDFVNIMMNIEELIVTLPQMFSKYPEQQIYKYDNYSDIFAFEPEYNATVPLVQFFAEQKDKYLLLYTKSNNVDCILDTKHNGHTIINWSISPATQSKFIEKETPTLEKRIEAIEKCQNAGYTVRVRFSPLIPIKNWRQEMDEMVESLLNKTQPDIITMDIIGFMKPDTFEDIIDNKLIDPQAYEILEEVKRTKKLYGKHLFPDDYRKEIYRHIFTKVQEIAPDVPVTICNETKDMWKDLEMYMGGMKPENYACCCGPDSVPGNPWLIKKA